MERPAGPRQPDKRHAAYESIFPSRPPILHGAPGQHIIQPVQQQQQQQQQQQHHPYTILPASYQPHITQPHPPSHALYNPPYYPTYPLPPLPAHSIQIDEHPEHHNNHNPLTPAQAYQARVLDAQHTPQQSTRLLSPSSSVRTSTTNPSRLSLNLEEDGFTLDFTTQEGDDDESELPWTQKPTQKQLPQIQTSSRSSTISDFPSSSSSVLSPRSSLYTQSPVSSEQHVPSVASAVAARRLSDSSRTMSRIGGPRRERTVQDRSMSLSAATANNYNTYNNSSHTVASIAAPSQHLVNRASTSRPTLHDLAAGRASPSSSRHQGRRTPLVYPALLSRVAEALRDRVHISDRTKDGLTYKNAFDGREAVDKIAYIIKTTDRNLALLLGRALDAQKFFHDVTYDHRLRDSSNELYQFRTAFVHGRENDHESGENDEAASPSTNQNHGGELDGHNNNNNMNMTTSSSSSEEDYLPSGVFTLLADCYSPTCSRDQLCYSIACPRRLEQQQQKNNNKPQPGLMEEINKDVLGDAPIDGATLWIHMVSQEVVNSVSDQEKKRQEAINEVIYTERDFVKDMEYLREFWINRLIDSDIIPQHKRTDFLEQVFWNIDDIIAVNTRLRDALNKRQKAYAIVEKIGDILLDIVPLFNPFVSYGAHQLYGKFEFEKEKSSNPAFAQFVEMTERLPESRKLELNAYLTKPTTRLARYPLLLGAVLKHTSDDNPDKTVLPEVIEMVKGFLARVNAESGKTENRFNLLQLEQQLTFRPGEEVDLRLSEEGREMIYKGTLSKRDGELYLWLFDHALLVAKPIKTKQGEQFKVYRRPIPLELLQIIASDDALINLRSAGAAGGGGATIVGASGTRNRRTLTRRPSIDGRPTPPAPAIPPPRSDGRGQHWITFVHLGRKNYSITLWASSQVSQRKWLEHIIKQQSTMRERSMIFDTVCLSQNYFVGYNKVHCAAPFNGGKRVVYGTDDGVYLSDLRESGRDPVKVLALLEVRQVDVLEDYQLLIVLSEGQVITFPLEALDPKDPLAGLKRAKRVSSHTSFFKAGFCLGKVLVCIVKSSQLSSTFKTMEPIEENVRSRSKPTFRALLQGGHETLKSFREFYIPVESTSIHYLKTKMCVGCSRGFEIVDLESLDTQGLLDPNDDWLEFVRKKENVRPMAIYRIGNEFLLCYDVFAFYVNKNGQRSRRDFLIHWEGNPIGFALHEPYVLAFEPSFVEVRHIETGFLSQVIQGSNMSLLFADTPPSVTHTGGYGYGAMHPPPPQGPDFNPYAQPNQYGSRMSLNGGYGSPHVRQPQGVGRHEILLASDDRVLALRSLVDYPQTMPDTMSMTAMSMR